MGNMIEKVSVFCMVSGCSPEIPSSLDRIFDSTGKDGITPGPLVAEAIATLVDDDERQGQEDMTVIGAIKENGEVVMPVDEAETDAAVHISNSPFRIIPHCRMGEGDLWYCGGVSPPDPIPSDIYYYPVLSHLIFMTQSASLPILSLATGGAMTPYRLWMLIVHKRFSEDPELSSIDYGEVVRQEDAPPIPMLSKEDLVALEELGDVELIRRAIIHQGGFWVWMRPDRFPHSDEPLDHDLSFIPVILDHPSDSQSLCSIEKLAFEILIEITSYLPLTTLLFFASSSRHLRSKLLGFSSDRDTVARAWIERSAPWYLPTSNDSIKTLKSVVVGWAYLRRCVESGSMKNRRRIWKVAEQLWKMADELAL